MDPDSIELNNLSKSFAYQKLASQIDSCEDRDELRNIANCLLYTSPSPRDLSTSRMPSSA